MSLGIQIDVCLVLGKEVVERAIEHPNDLRALVVHDGRRLLVPEDGHGEAGSAARNESTTANATKCLRRLQLTGLNS